MKLFFSWLFVWFASYQLIIELVDWFCLSYIDLALLYIICYIDFATPWIFSSSAPEPTYSHSITSLFDHLCEIRRASKCIAWVVASSGTWWSCFAARFACYSWSLLTPRRFGAVRIIERRLEVVFGSDRGDCEGFLTFLRRRAKRYSSRLLVAYVIFILCWLRGTLVRVGVWGHFAREPPSECVAIIRTSLPVSKWTSVKIIVSTFVFEVIDLHWHYLLWLIGSFLYTVVYSS